MHKIMAQRKNYFFGDNESFQRVPPRYAGGNGNQGINFVWPYNDRLAVVAAPMRKL